MNSTALTLMLGFLILLAGAQPAAAQISLEASGTPAPEPLVFATETFEPVIISASEAVEIKTEKAIRDLFLEPPEIASLMLTLKNAANSDPKAVATQAKVLAGPEILEIASEPKIIGTGPSVPEPIFTLPSLNRMPRLTGVVIVSEKDRTALLDGQMLREGQWIGEYKVSLIRKNSVLLRRDKEEHTLYVSP